MRTPQRLTLSSAEVDLGQIEAHLSAEMCYINSDFSRHTAAAAEAEETTMEKPVAKEAQIEFRGDHIYVYLPEDYDFDPAGRGNVWARLKSLCEENKTARVLVEGRLPEMERETSDVIDAGLHTAAVPRLWLAFHFENFVPTEQSEVFDAVAASKGVRVKHFADREKALQWLRNNSPS